MLPSTLKQVIKLDWMPELERVVPTLLDLAEERLKARFPGRALEGKVYIGEAPLTECYGIPVEIVADLTSPGDPDQADAVFWEAECSKDLAEVTLISEKVVRPGDDEALKKRLALVDGYGAKILAGCSLEDALRFPCPICDQPLQLTFFPHGDYFSLSCYELDRHRLLLSGGPSDLPPPQLVMGISAPFPSSKDSWPSWWEEDRVEKEWDLVPKRLDEE